MKCDQFERDVTEWIRGRCDSVTDQMMHDHDSLCANCRQLSEVERQLMRIMAHSAAETPSPDIWRRLETRIIQTPQQVHKSFKRFFALGGSAAAVGACALALMFMPRPPIVTTGVAKLAAPDAEKRVVQLVADSQRMSESETDSSHIGSGDAAAILVARNE